MKQEICNRCGESHQNEAVAKCDSCSAVRKGTMFTATSAAGWCGDVLFTCYRCQGSGWWFWRRPFIKLERACNRYRLGGWYAVVNYDGYLQNCRIRSRAQYALRNVINMLELNADVDWDSNETRPSDEFQAIADYAREHLKEMK